MATQASVPARRRRGKELDAALLAAAWSELVDTGYARLTMAKVAARAHTSEAVLYRRWANKDKLVLAAIEHYRATHPVDPPDTGSLRDDLIALLTAVSRARAAVYAIAAAAVFAGMPAGVGLTPAQARDQLMGDQPALPIRPVYLRARDRGELDLDRIPGSVLAMPFDLVRHDLLMDLQPPPPQRIRSIVDELFLPLVQRYRSG